MKSRNVSNSSLPATSINVGVAGVIVGEVAGGTRVVVAVAVVRVVVAMAAEVFRAFL